MIQACRARLQAVAGPLSNPGLLLARYLRTTDDQGAGKRTLFDQARSAQKHARDLYRLAYRRWEEDSAGASAMILSVRGRLVIGLGAESALETGLTLHHTYGVPVLPGSALKGLAAHYCDRVWGQQDPAFRRDSGPHYHELFGATDDSGHITFHDAWITPESLIAPNQGLVLDVMTPHHGLYYMAGPDDNAAPTDFDDPNPVSFLSVAGAFRVAVSCDVPGEVGDKWARLALKLLTEALGSWGIGGKTNAGYGRLRA